MSPSPNEQSAPKARVTSPNASEASDRARHSIPKASTRSVAKRLYAASLHREARRLETCIPHVHRCGHWACPRCQAHEAGKHQLKVQEHLRAAFRRAGLVGLLTVTLPSSDLDKGFQLFKAAFGDFRRSKAWKESGITGGATFIEAIPSRPGAVREWLIHAHVIVEIRPPKSKLARIPGFNPDHWSEPWFVALFGLFAFYGKGVIDFDCLGATWLGVVRRRSDLLATGRFDLRSRGNVGWRIDERGRVSSRLAVYVTKRFRTDLLTYTDTQLAEIGSFRRRTRPRLARGPFGTWCSTKKRTP